jgi:1-aminocyclopropane-1-carboxylate deaminase/D-cysteine desulfhydrase-like pyridoxal-dependent ACC family enzyme
VGHLLGGLELATQLHEPPHAIVAPFGSTGTVAGLTLAVAALGWPTRVIGVRVAPRIVANAWRATRLAHRVVRLLERVAPWPRPQAPLIIEGLGRGYGYPTPAGEAARQVAAGAGLDLDSTYSAKAFAALGGLADRGFRRVVFWHTFAPPVSPEEPPR